MATDNQAPFRPRARILRTLGSELISNERVALVELVKNAYDADASTCLIRFVGDIAVGLGSVLVIDDGHGMSSDMLASGWLELASTAKRANRLSESGERRVLGEKGVGRLAAARLADSLLVTTKRWNKPEVQLLIDWTDFDNDEAFLDEIEVAWSEGASSYFAADGPAEVALVGAGAAIDANSPHGTSLQMDGLRSSWDEESVRELKRALERLAPGASTAKIPFTIVLDLPEPFESFSGPIGTPEGLEDPLYELTGHVDAFGHGVLEYKQAAPPLKERIEANLWAKSARKPEAGAFDLDLKVWDRDRAGIAVAAPKLGVRDFRRMLDPLAGVSVYRNGFRVFPYGESGDDWLRLDARRVNNPSVRISNNQVIGRVNITADGNPDLQDQSNRQGLQEGPPYEDLRTLVVNSLAELEVRRRVSRRPAPAAGDRGGLFEDFDIDDVAKAARASGASSAVVRLIEERQRRLTSGVERVKDLISSFQLQATLGQLVDRVVHDGRTAIGPLRNKADLLATAVQSSDQDRISRRQEELLTVIATQTGVLQTLFDGLDPLSGRKRGRPRKVDALETLHKAIAAADYALLKDVTISVVGEPQEVTWAESDIIIAVVNLVNNALYWVQRSNSVPKVVQVRLMRGAGSEVVIGVSDSGPGVPESLREAIFDPYISTKPDGTGLGLVIAGNVAANYGGELGYAPQGPLAGGEFVLTIKKRVS